MRDRRPLSSTEQVIIKNAATIFEDEARELAKADTEWGEARAWLFRQHRNNLMTILTRRGSWPADPSA